MLYHNNYRDIVTRLNRVKILCSKNDIQCETLRLLRMTNDRHRDQLSKRDRDIEKLTSNFQKKRIFFFK